MEILLGTWMKTNLSDQQQKGLITDHNLFLSAGAGAGKTSVLTERYVHLLLQQRISPHRLLAITFTKKAADEMHHRVMDIIQEKDESLFYGLSKSELLKEMSRAKISTFDALYKSIYVTHGPSYGFSPQYDVISSIEKEEYLNKIDTRFFALLSSGANKIKNFGGLPLEDLKQSTEYLSKQDKLFSGIKAIKTWLRKDVQFWEPTYLLTIIQFSLAELSLFEYVNEVLSQEPSEEQIIVCKKLSEFLANYSVNYSVNIQRQQSDELIIGLKEWCHHHGVIAQSNQSKPNIRSLVDFLIQLNLMPTDLTGNVATTRFYFSKLLFAWHSEFQHEKDLTNKLDFGDVQHRVYQLLTTHPEIRQQLFSEVDSVMIDEFQDTNWMNWSILKSYVWDEVKGNIASKKLFIVGDPKQSIYGFRQAQVEIVKALQDLIQTSNQSDHCRSSGWYELTENYRSDPRILSFINDVMLQEFHLTNKNDQFNSRQVVYRELSPKKPEGILEQPIKIFHINKSGRAKEIAGYLYQWYKKNIQNERPTRLSVLATKNNTLVEIGDELQRHQIPHKYHAELSVYREDAAFHIINLLAWIQDPTDDVSGLGVCKSPLILLKDESLLDLKIQSPKDYLIEQIKKWQSELSSLDIHEQEKIKLLKELLSQSVDLLNSKGLSGLLWYWLDHSPYLIYQSEISTYEHVLISWKLIIQQVQQQEKSGHLTTKELVKWLQLNRKEEAAGLSVERSTPNETGIDLFTVHKSKGLTFQHTLLINDFDSQKNSDHSQPFTSDFRLGMVFKYYDTIKNEFINSPYYNYVKNLQLIREQAEKNRVMYVAMTRASESLTICADFSKELREEADTKKSKSGINRTWSYRFYHFLKNNYHHHGLLIQHIEDQPELFSLPKVEAIQPWTYAVPEKISAPNFLQWLGDQFPKSLPSDSYYTNFTATGLMAVSTCGTASRLKKISIEKSKQIKGKTELPAHVFGTMVHAGLAGLPLPELELASHHEQEKIKTIIQEVSQHPVIVNLKQNEHQFELPFFVPVDGFYMQGSIDLIAVNDSYATILDFKTNKLPESRTMKSFFEQYLIQFKVYTVVASYLYPQLKQFEAVIFSTDRMDVYQLNVDISIVGEWKNELVHYMTQIANGQFDKDFKELESLECKDCSFYSFCYPSLSEEMMFAE